MATPTTLPAAFTAGQVLTAAQQNALRGAFRVLQVVSTIKTDTFTTTSTSYVDLTGVSVSITPSSSSSKILVIVNVFGTNTNSEMGACQLVRGSTPIAIGDAAGNRLPISFIAGTFNANTPTLGGITFLDSPSTTSATTYKVQIRSSVGGNTVVVNRGSSDTDIANNPRAVSTITVMEISA